MAEDERPSLEMPSFSLRRKRRAEPDQVPVAEPEVPAEPEVAPASRSSPESVTEPEVSAEPTPDPKPTPPAPPAPVEARAPRLRRRTPRAATVPAQAVSEPATVSTPAAAHVAPEPAAPEPAVAEPEAPEPETPEPEPTDTAVTEPAPPRPPLAGGGAATAAAVTGLVVGVLGVALSWLAGTACDMARGTSSCGGTVGLPLLLAALAVMAYAGAALLRGLRVAEPGSTSLLATGVLAVLVMVFLLGSLDEAWAAVAVPVLAVLAYTGSWWLTAAVTDDAGDDGPGSGAG